MLSAYPAITNAEFDEASRILERAYSTSREVSGWIDVKRSIEGLLIRQKRPSLHASCVSEVRKTEGQEKDEANMDEIEQEDEVIYLIPLIVHFSQVALQELLQRSPSEPLQEIVVDYSIILSPTYQVPVLWFTSNSITVTRANALDRVYEEIVSPVSRTGLREIGVLGGISLAEHPMSGLPAFFIHPCRTQEALEVVRPDKDVSPIEYMMLWFGIIAAPVGLSLPLEIATWVSTRVPSAKQLS